VNFHEWGKEIHNCDAVARELWALWAEDRQTLMRLIGELQEQRREIEAKIVQLEKALWLWKQGV
jgi:hypothetical protein